MAERNQPDKDGPLRDEHVALALGELDAQTAARLDASLDAATRTAIGQIRATVAAMGDRALEAAPASLVRRLEAMGRVSAVGEAVAQVTGALRRLVARVVFDSRVSPALAGFRGGADGRQLVFSSEAGDVHLRLSGPDERDPRVTIRGSVETTEASELQGAIARIGGAEDRAEANIDEDGMFVLRIAPGSHPMIVRLARTEIDLGLLDVA
ncbi:MAG: hypothetical protein KDA05_02020 [Phycisphaerales bacterium]|nr:hypothetical protein [Phycisphaerales bacterium]MCB9841109.1 hypothetical protein [Phycisphaeraceae bacterium]